MCPEPHTDQMEEEAKRLGGLFSLAKRSCKACESKPGLTTTQRLFKQRSKAGTNGCNMAVNKFRLEAGFRTSEE